MSLDRSETHTLAEEAAHWLLELEEPGDATLRRFAAWLESSPRHVEEFLLAAAVWREFDHFDGARRLDIERLLEEARSNVRTLAPAAPEPSAPAPEPARGPRIRRTAWAAAAVAVAILVGVALWIFHSAPPHIYATARGEQRALKLEDGSVVYLNTESRVEVSFSKHVRGIRLIEGEAMFNVEHDTARPFRVIAGPTVIQAVGTRFNVYRSDAGATVSVVEGVVQISPGAASEERSAPHATEVESSAGSASGEPHRARVTAGEQAHVSPDGEISKRSVPDLAQLVAWRERRLVFRADALGDVATEFNRYNAVQLHIEGDALRGKQITGVFDADDPRSFVQFLERDSTLAVDDRGSEIWIRAR